MYFFAILLTVITNIFYHVALKIMPSNANPMIALFVAYTLAAISSLLLTMLFPIKYGLMTEMKHVGFAGVLLGMTIVGLELGFMLAYRAGWNISTAALISNILVTITLLMLGKFFFHEKLTVIQYVGVFTSLAGVVMIHLGKQ